MIFRGNNEYSQEDYNQGLFSLFKRGILEAKENEQYTMAEEAKSIVQTIDESKYVISIESKADIPQYCIFYVDDGIPTYVVCQPGSRKNEYIKLMITNKEGFDVFIKDAAIFDNDILINSLCLYKLDAKTGEGYSSLIIDANTVVDEMVYQKGSYEKSYPYSKKIAEEILFNMMGGSDDFS